MNELSGRVQTVLGPIDPSQIGHTQPHEHLFVDLVPPDQKEEPGSPILLETLGHLRRNWTSNPDNLRLSSLSDAMEEMRQFKASGGGTIVDMSCMDISRNPHGLVRISRETGVHVVMGTGYYVSPYHPPQVERMSEEQISEQIVSDIFEGVDDKGIRAGIIGEIGLDWPVAENEVKVLHAAARAQQETGASLNVHPGRNPSAPLDAIHIIKDGGGDPERTIISHMDRTLFNMEDMLELAETGCYLEFDLFGHESSFYPLAPIDMPNDAMRIDYLMGIMKAGYRDKLLVSQDICTKTRLTKFGGEGYCHILNNVIPMMKRKGMNDDDIETLTVGNPARVLTLS